MINPNGTEICNGWTIPDGDADVGHLGLDDLCSEFLFEVLQSHPNAVDGEYYITFPSGTELAECDMGSFGGGWTQVFMDDMSPPIQAGLCNKLTAGFGGKLGGYGIISSGSINNPISTRSIPHSEVWVEFDYIPDSWDYSDNGLGPDFGYANLTILQSCMQILIIIHRFMGRFVVGTEVGTEVTTRLYVSSIQSGYYSNFMLTIDRH